MARHVHCDYCSKTAVIKNSTRPENWMLITITYYDKKIRKDNIKDCCEHCKSKIKRFLKIAS